MIVVVVTGAAVPPSTATAAGCPFAPSTITSVVPDPIAVAAYCCCISFCYSIIIYLCCSGVKIGIFTNNTCTRLIVARLALLLIPTLVTSGLRIGDRQEKAPSLEKSIISCTATKSAPEATSNRGKVNSSLGTGPPTNFYNMATFPPICGYWTCGEH